MRLHTKTPMMKTPLVLLIAALCMAFTFQASAQALPDVALKDIEGNTVNTSGLVGEEGPTVFCLSLIHI